MSKKPNDFWWRWPHPHPPPPPPVPPVTLETVERQLVALAQQVAALINLSSDTLAHLQRMENQMLTTQADIDALTQIARNLVTSQGVLSGHVDAVDTALQAFIARNPGVDITDLAKTIADAQAADDTVDQHVQTLQAKLTP